MDQERFLDGTTVERGFRGCKCRCIQHIELDRVHAFEVVSAAHLGWVLLTRHRAARRIRLAPPPIGVPAAALMAVFQRKVFVRQAQLAALVQGIAGAQELGRADG